MTSSVLGTTWLALIAAATLAVQGQSAAPGQRSSAAPRPKRAVIVTGENSYNGHVWKETSAEIKNILDAGKDFAEVAIQPDPNFIASDEFLTYDVAVFDFRNQNPLAQEDKVEANLLKFLGQPKGLVTVHWANGAFPFWPEFVNIVGRSQLSVHDPRGSFLVKIVNPNHPITKDMKSVLAAIAGYAVVLALPSPVIGQTIKLGQAMVFYVPDLKPDADVKAFEAYVTGQVAPAWAKQAPGMELLKALGLADRATHRPDALSGGEQQRVAIAAPGRGHDRVREAVHLPDVMDGDDIGMRECGDGVGLGRESIECLAVDLRAGHHLDRDVAFQPGIGSTIDLAHRAFSEQRPYMIGTQLVAGVELHRTVARVLKSPTSPVG